MLVKITRQEAARLKYASGRFSTIYKRLSKRERIKHMRRAAHAETNVTHLYNKIVRNFPLAKAFRLNPYLDMQQVDRDDLRDASFTLNAMFKSLYPSKKPEAQSAYNKARDTLRHFVKLYDAEAKKRGGNA